MPQTLTIPSIPALSYSIFTLLSQHPLFVEPLVLHPVERKPVGVGVYRFMDGFPIGIETGTVACCIIPASGGEDLSPQSTNTSVLYKPYTIGQNHDEIIFHLILKFYYQEVNLPGLNLSNNPALIEVPTQALTDPQNLLLTGSTTRSINLELNPAYEIVGNYLDLARLALLDQQSNPQLRASFRSIEVIHQNLPTSKWDSGTNVFLQQGSLMLRIVAYISRGWRDKFKVPVSQFNLDLGSEDFQTEIPLQTLKESPTAKETSSSSFSTDSFIKLDQLNRPRGVAGLTPQGFLSPIVIPPEFITEAKLQSELDNRLAQLEVNPSNPGGSSLRLEVPFTESNLSMIGILPITHGFNKRASSVRIITNEGEEAIPDRIIDTLTSSAIYLESYRPLTGNWLAIVSA